MVAWLQVINRALGQDLWASPGTYSPWSPPWGPRFCSSFAARPSSPRSNLRARTKKNVQFFAENNPIIFKSQVITFFPIHAQNDEISSIYLFQHEYEWNTIGGAFETISLRTILHIRSTISTPRTQLLNFRIDRQLSSHQSTSTHERSKFFGAERCIIRLSHRIVSYRWEEESAARRTPIPLL